MEQLEKIYALFKESSGIFTDSRKIINNGLFFALKGPKFDGNQYAKEAIEKGAIAAIIDDKKISLTSNKFYLVENAHDVLKKLANFHRKKLKCPVLGITGSNGKTTTKELIKSVLKSKYKTNATFSNQNNNIGVPLTLLNTPLNSEFTIIEMGANHIGEIAELCEIADPTCGFITNFGQAHIEGFGSEKGVEDGKSELYEYLNKSNGTIFLNIDNKNQLKRVNKKLCISFGENKKANYSFIYKKHKNFLEIEFNDKKFSCNLYGTYNFPNIAASIVVGDYFKVSLTQIQKSLKKFILNNNRSELVSSKKHKIILDAYNANPSSMEIAINCFYNEFPKNNLIIIGDMFELGKKTIPAHQKIMKLTGNLCFTKIITVGENFFKSKTNAKNCMKFKKTKDLVKYLSQNTINENHILVKGSRAMNLEKILPLIIK